MAQRLLSIVLLAIAGVCFLIVALIAWNGGRWALWGLSAENPTPRLVLGGLALAGWYALGPGRPRSRRDGWALAGKGLLLGASLWVSLALAERGVRAYLRHTQGFNSLEYFRAYEEGLGFRPRSTTPMVAVVGLSANRRLIYDLRPGLDMVFGEHQVITNRDGMREREDYPRDRSPDSVRIIGIGDSGMFGWGVAQTNNYLAVLETNLKRAADGPLIEVLNLAVPGYNTWQEVELLRTKGLAYDPDIVVLGWCDNDLQLPTFLFAEQTFDEKGFSYLWLFLFRRAEFVQRITPMVIESGNVDPELVDPVLLKSGGDDGFREALETLRDLSQTEGFKVLVFGPLTPEIAGMVTEVGLDQANTYLLIPPVPFRRRNTYMPGILARRATGASPRPWKRPCASAVGFPEASLTVESGDCCD